MFISSYFHPDNQYVPCGCVAAPIISSSIRSPASDTQHSMDVALSLATGLGLRVYLIRMVSPASPIAPAILGLWEGILVHQLSFRPPPSLSSSPLDHCLAFGLRLMVDFLIAGNMSRVKLVGLWAAIGSLISESLLPAFSDGFTASNQSSPSRRDREKRRRHTRSTLSHVPSHVPSHIRIYEEPEESPRPLPVRAPSRPQTSTPIQPTIQIDTGSGRPDDQAFMSPNFAPATPPSFFLHAETEPSPFPDSPASPLKPTSTTTIVSQVPTRPTSALAFYESEKPAPHQPSAGPSSRPSHHLPPTPPDSTLRERTMDSRVDRLSTIEEITSRSEHITDDIEQEPVEGEENYILVSHGGGTPLPVPNATSFYVNAEDGTPMASVAPSPPAVPLPVPPIPESHPMSDGGDELRTPGPHVLEVQKRYRCVYARWQHEPGREVDTLSPLMLDSQSIAPDQIIATIPVPGSTLSSYAILQPPVAPRPLGPLLDAFSEDVLQGPEPESRREEEEPGPFSDASDAESVLSARVPVKLLERGEDIRKQAIEAGKELERLKAELHKARAEGRARDILFLKDDIRKAEELKKKLDERAARRYYAGRNHLQKPNTIDVHGLKPEEALRKTEDAFREVLRNGQSTLRVIVGKGLHSKNGVPVVKNYIREVMKNQRIPCEVDPSNAGQLILTLSPPKIDHPLADAS
ncbi:hypothetical protein NP233_g4675 [Leucocoprinus birnbaumii]|uniref:Smr domain-containing protein n=1 Tax=Leucocoprinus birnbaumii TaxID=56174 RepID=A0AAD5VUB0_9AGAR|nr:hypothetical protein NP233_g4675 [Leucocoprinus birnbaumii]